MMVAVAEPTSACPEKRSLSARGSLRPGRPAQPRWPRGPRLERGSGRARGSWRADRGWPRHWTAPGGRLRRRARRPRSPLGSLPPAGPVGADGRRRRAAGRRGKDLLPAGRRRRPQRVGDRRGSDYRRGRTCGQDRAGLAAGVNASTPLDGSALACRTSRPSTGLVARALQGRQEPRAVGGPRLGLARAPELDHARGHADLSRGAGQDPAAALEELLGLGRHVAALDRRRRRGGRRPGRRRGGRGRRRRRPQVAAPLQALELGRLELARAGRGVGQGQRVRLGLRRLPAAPLLLGRDLGAQGPVAAPLLGRVVAASLPPARPLPPALARLRVRGVEAGLPLAPLVLLPGASAGRAAPALALGPQVAAAGETAPRLQNRSPSPSSRSRASRRWRAALRLLRLRSSDV